MFQNHLDWACHSYWSTVTTASWDLSLFHVPEFSPAFLIPAQIPWYHPSWYFMPLCIFLWVCMHVCLRVYVCVRVCVWVKEIPACVWVKEIPACREACARDSYAPAADQFPFQLEIATHQTLPHTSFPSGTQPCLHRSLLAWSVLTILHWWQIKNINRKSIPCQSFSFYITQANRQVFLPLFKLLLIGWPQLYNLC